MVVKRRENNNEVCSYDSYTYLNTGYRLKKKKEEKKGMGTKNKRAK